MTPIARPDLTDSDVSVVIPVYKRGGAVAELHKRVSQSCAEFGLDLILVDDASNDGTWDAIVALQRNNANVTAVRLARNSGQHQAILAGLRLARCGITVTIDDDFDQAPEDIPLLVKRLIETRADIVYGEREIRSARFAPRSIASQSFRRLVGQATGVPDLKRRGPFRAFRTSLRDNFSQYSGTGASLDALLGWGAERVEFVVTSARRQPLSASRYSLPALVGAGFDAIVLYSRRPAVVFIGSGVAAAIAAAALFIYVVVRTVLFGSSGTGFAFVAALVSFFSAFQLILLGFMMHQVSRIFEASIGRQGYVMAEVLRSE